MVYLVAGVFVVNHGVFGNFRSVIGNLNFWIIITVVTLLVISICTICICKNICGIL